MLTLDNKAAYWSAQTHSSFSIQFRGISGLAFTSQRAHTSQQIDEKESCVLPRDLTVSLPFMAAGGEHKKRGKSSSLARLAL